MLKTDEKFIQISCRPAGEGAGYSSAALFGLTNLGNIYIRVDGEWSKLETPNEQVERLEKEDKEPKKFLGLF